MPTLQQSTHALSTESAITPQQSTLPLSSENELTPQQSTLPLSSENKLTPQQNTHPLFTEYELTPQALINASPQTTQLVQTSLDTVIESIIINRLPPMHNQQYFKPFDVARMIHEHIPSGHTEEGKTIKVNGSKIIDYLYQMLLYLVEVLPCFV